MNKQLEEKGKENRQEIEVLKSSLDVLRKSYKDIQAVSAKRIEDHVYSAFRKLFSANQVDLILGRKKRVVWTAEEIATAFSLR